MTTKKTAKKPVGNYIVVVAEYDESGSDGLAIDNALSFDTPEEAEKYVEEVAKKAEEVRIEEQELGI